MTEPVAGASRPLEVAILSARTGWQTDELLRALSARGHRGRLAPYEALVARLGTRAGVPRGLEADGLPLHAMDAVLARIIPGGSLEQVIFRVDALHWLEERGVAVVNAPRAIERCVDKFYTSALLQDAGLPTPQTMVCERLDVAMDAVRAMGDVVIKPLFGAMGHGMVRVSDPDTAWRVLRALELSRAVYYVQQAVEHGGRDVRVFVVGDRVLGAIERLAPEGEWRTNVSRGAAARAIELPPEWARMAVEAARVVGADYAGVDLLPAADGSVHVLEVNGIPGWEGLQRATGIDVADAIVARLEVRVAGLADIDRVVAQAAGGA
jgi:RimK family alpha-L-glutamate ligase